MISRNKSKIDAKLEGIKQKFPNIETIGIEADLSKLVSMADYRDFVQSSGLDNLDIAVLCLNAGLGNIGSFDLMDDSRLESMININELHVVYLLKALSAQLLARDKRSAVLIVSSIAANATVGMYCMTKRMVSNFGQAVHYELKENVDVTVWEPGFIWTRIIMEKPPGFLAIETNQAVGDILAKLGKERRTRGSLIFEMYPMSLLDSDGNNEFYSKELREKNDKFVEL